MGCGCRGNKKITINFGNNRCPKCSSPLQKVHKYDGTAKKTTVYYKCLNRSCGYQSSRLG